MVDFEFTPPDLPESTLKAFEAALNRDLWWELEAKHADRYKAVRDGFWWRIKIGTGTETIGRFYTKTECDRMILQLQRAFNEGIYVACTERARAEGESNG